MLGWHGGLEFDSERGNSKSVKYGITVLFKKIETAHNGLVVVGFNICLTNFRNRTKFRTYGRCNIKNVFNVTALLSRHSSSGWDYDLSSSGLRWPANKTAFTSKRLRIMRTCSGRRFTEFWHNEYIYVSRPVKTEDLNNRRFVRSRFDEVTWFRRSTA